MAQNFTRRSFLASAALLGAAPAPAPAATAADLLQPFEPDQVVAGGAIGHRIEITRSKNLLALNVDRDFLRPFQAIGSTRESYIGLGKLLDSVVRMARHTGDPALVSLKRHIVEELARAQAPDGYLGLFPPADRLVKLWDIHEMSYLLLGLLSDYRFFRDEQALKTARKLADYLLTGLAGKLDRIPTREVHLAMGMTGCDRAMLAAHELTGDERYLEFCLRDLDLLNWNLNIVQGRRMPYYGHAYAFLCRSLAQVELYRRNRIPKLMAQTNRALDFLRKEGGLLVSGNFSRSECWFSDQAGEGELGETCATAYFVRLMGSLLQLEGASLYGDLMERTIYNALFAAQSPDGRRLRYYTPFEGERQYFKLDTYCCPCNYRRIVAELPQMIFYRSGGGVAVNLFTTADLTAELEGAGKTVVRQETDYPASGAVRLQVLPARTATFPLLLRVPRWCRAARVEVNGEAVPAESGAFLRIERQWKRGDAVTLKLEMPWRLVKGSRSQQGRVAVLRGPVVFGLNTGRNPGFGTADPRDLVLDPASLRDEPDTTLRPGGLACRVKAQSRRTATDLDLLLTEFIDPADSATYFYSRGTELTCEDELLA